MTEPTTTASAGLPLGVRLAILALPMMVAGAACTRASDPSEDSAPAVTTPETDGSDSTDPTTPDSTPSPTTTPDTGTGTTPSTPDTAAPDTAAPDTAAPDTGGGTEPPATDAPDADDSDDDSDSDSTVVTVAAVIGASLLLGVAIVWMVRMNRSNDGRRDDEIEPPLGPPGEW